MHAIASYRRGPQSLIVAKHASSSLLTSPRLVWEIGRPAAFLGHLFLQAHENALSVSLGLRLAVCTSVQEAGYYLHARKSHSEGRGMENCYYTSINT